MRTIPRTQGAGRLAVAGFLLACACAAPATEPAASQPVTQAVTASAAQWKAQDVTFTYMGFTAHYSCTGLRERMLIVLRELGAGKPMELMDYGCADETFHRDRMPTVHMQFSSLQPGSGAAPVSGYWKQVNLVGPGKLDSGECELMEQIVSDVLPHFTVRNVDKVPACMPHAPTLVTAMRLEVFMPVPQN
jgi:hypothetical protein